MFMWAPNSILKFRKGPMVGLFFLAVVLTALISFWSVINGSIPFWFDPARDLLLAVGNLEKPTLIGPPTGIPGIFYGPYWIWAISSAMRISPDPRIVTLLILTIPYFLFFPLILWQFSKWITREWSFILWLLFILTYESFTTFLWNPHLTPLLFLLLTFIIISTKSGFGSKKEVLKVFLAGLCSGFILNIHVSFGLGVLFSILFFFTIEGIVSYIKETEFHWKTILARYIVILVTFSIGFGLTLLPFIAFEIRHGFGQTKAFLQTFTQAALYNSASVGQTGLTKIQILHEFLQIPKAFLRMETLAVLAIFSAGIIRVFSKRRERGKQWKVKKRALGFLFLTATVTLSLFVTSKNPVWHYHFIGFEVIFLLVLGFLFEGSKIFSRLGLLWGGIVVIIYIGSYIKTFSVDPLTISSLSTKQYIVEKILQDGDKPFIIQTFSPAIYTYDYDYLFDWLGRENYRRDSISKDVSVVYLIIPATSKDIYEDFINYKTPHDQFFTVKQWKIPDGT